MGFASTINSRCIVIDDTNFHLYGDDSATPDGLSKGYIPRDYEQYPEGTFADPFPLPIIPREQWPELIEKMERDKTRLSDIRRTAGLKSLNQNGTNYCWVNAVVGAVMLLRAKAGHDYIPLSPASVGSIITGFQNVGGWGSKALEQIIKGGVTPQAIWPANKIDRQYYTEDAKLAALDYRVTEWWELRPRNFDQYMTCLLHRIPVPIGLNWWSHEVLGLDPVIIRAASEIRLMQFGSRIWNSWGDEWSDNGEGILSESKSTPDEAVAPRVAIAA